jgi:hypothetical protein
VPPTGAGVLGDGSEPPCGTGADGIDGVVTVTGETPGAVTDTVGTGALGADSFGAGGSDGTLTAGGGGGGGGGVTCTGGGAGAVTVTGGGVGTVTGRGLFTGMGTSSDPDTTGSPAAPAGMAPARTQHMISQTMPLFFLPGEAPMRLLAVHSCTQCLPAPPRFMRTVDKSERLELCA